MSFERERKPLERSKFFDSETNFKISSDCSNEHLNPLQLIDSHKAITDHPPSLNHYFENG